MERSDRPSVGVLGYGSLVGPEALSEITDDWRKRTTPVCVEGFQRRFDQAASWRDTDGRERAVLNVVRDAEVWCNAILLGDLSRAEYAAVRRRERGYRLVEVRDEQIEAFDGGSVPVVDDIVLIAVGERRDERIAPIPSYVETCIEGASYWGEPFLGAFLDTTVLTGGETLRTHREGSE